MIDRCRSCIGPFVVLLVTLAACTAAPASEGATPTASSSSAEVGGVLRAAMVIEPPGGLDPQLENYNVSFALFRCCLVRTLLAYPGVEGPEGLAPRPDLAIGMPATDDEVEWTFELRDDVRYAPPFDHVTVTAGDVIRAIERLLELGGGASTDFRVIDGAAGFSAGEAPGVSGLSAPDPSTLIVRTTRPFPELPFLFAQPATAPIPAGAADGHDEDYGRYLVSSGPYMIEGADATASPSLADRPEASGFVPGRSLTLVRNPSWDAATDPLRPAYVDRIEVTFGGSEDVLARQVEEGEIDLVLDVNASPAAIERYGEDPMLRDRLHVHPTEAIAFVSVNHAIPPFDDVDVRRAVTLAIDREALLRVGGGEVSGTPTDLLVPGSLLGDPGAAEAIAVPREEALAAAQDAMRASRYDTDGDGRCDAAACRAVLTLSPNDQVSMTRTTVIRESLMGIGLDLAVKSLEFGEVYRRGSSPGLHVAMTTGLAWAGSYPHPSRYLEPLLHSSGLADEFGTNLALIGASPAQLDAWGYGGIEVSNLDTEIEACAAEGTACWGELNEHVSRELVAYVPLYLHHTVKTLSDRVTAYTFDQANLAPALDRIALG